MKLLSEYNLKASFNKFLKELHNKHFLESQRYIKHSISYLAGPNDEIYESVKYFNNKEKIFIKFSGITYRIQIEKAKFTTTNLKSLYGLSLTSLN